MYLNKIIVDFEVLPSPPPGITDLSNSIVTSACLRLPEGLIVLSGDLALWTPGRKTTGIEAAWPAIPGYCAE